MKKWPLIPAAAAALATAFLAGRWSATGLPGLPGQSDTWGGGEASSRSLSPLPPSPGGADASAMKSKRGRPATPSPQDGGRMIPVPENDVWDVVLTSYLQGNFRDLAGQSGQPLGKGLALLGVSESDRKAADAIIARAKKELEEAEKRLVTVRETTTDTITLDRSAMLDFSKEVAERTRRDLRAALPEEIGKDITEGGIPWDSFYMPPGNTDVKLQLYWRNDRVGIISNASDGGTQLAGPVRATPAADGTFDAGHVVTDRWQNLVRGIRLTPRQPAPPR